MGGDDFWLEGPNMPDDRNHEGGSGVWPPKKFWNCISQKVHIDALQQYYFVLKNSWWLPDTNKSGWKKYLVANFSKDLYGIIFLLQKWMNLEEYGTLQTLSEPKSI